MKKEKQKCKSCDNEPAAFFHSGCCSAHFEGIVLEDQTLAIACVKCGQFIAKLQDKKTMKGG